MAIFKSRKYDLPKIHNKPAGLKSIFKLSQVPNNRPQKYK